MLTFMSRKQRPTVKQLFMLVATLALICTAVFGAVLTHPVQAAPLGGPVTCTGPDCIHHSLSTQAVCTQIGPLAPGGSGSGWGNGLSTQADQKILGGDVVAYKIQWSTGWSDWYVTGVNDIDWKYNTAGNDMRRVWSYFIDHTHTYLICK